MRRYFNEILTALPNQAVKDNDHVCSTALLFFAVQYRKKNKKAELASAEIANNLVGTITEDEDKASG